MLDLRFRPIDRWPVSRTAPGKRRTAIFRSTYAQTLDLLEDELYKVRAKDIVIQAGFTLDQIRNDGWPRSGARPTDHGVILCFKTKDGPLSFPCDTFDWWQDNVRAIALSLQALRSVDRYGVTKSGEQYRGWAQLPAPSGNGEIDRETAAEILAAHCDHSAHAILDDVGVAQLAWREARRKAHPDAGGGHDDFVRVDQAWIVLKG